MLSLTFESPSNARAPISALVCMKTGVAFIFILGERATAESLLTSHTRVVWSIKLLLCMGCKVARGPHVMLPVLS